MAELNPPPAVLEIAKNRRKGDELRVRMINISPDAIHPMHFHGHFTKEIARDGTDVANTSSAKVENTVLLAPGQTVDVSVKMDAPGKGAWLFHCHVNDHINAGMLTRFRVLP